MLNNKALVAYIIGVALGDGNLSNYSGRAARLRVTCDKKYPELLTRIQKSIRKILPDNKIQIVNRKGCFDVSCYSNYWPKILGWHPDKGSKYVQKVKIPVWILEDPKYTRKCLKGLFETDGCIYIDRKYKMANFVSTIPSLAMQVYESIKFLGYRPNLQTVVPKIGKEKYTIRLSRNAEKFIKEINMEKD